MSTFNVGDVVRVDNLGQRESGRGICWAAGMHEYNHCIFKVRSVTNGYSCRLEGAGHWNFDNDWLFKTSKFKGNKQ